MVRRKNRDDEDMFIDEGKVKYIGRSGRSNSRRDSFEDLSVIEREERGDRIEESRFRRRWRI